MSFVNTCTQACAQTLTKLCDAAFPAVAAGAVVGSLGAYAVNYCNEKKAAAAAAAGTQSTPAPATVKYNLFASAAAVALTTYVASASKTIDFSSITKYSLVNLSASYLRTAAAALLGLKAAQCTYSYVAKQGEGKETYMALGKLFAAAATASLIGFGIKKIA